MEKGQFDELSRTLGKSGPRRLLLQGLGSGALGLFVAGLLTDETDAKKRRRRRRRQGGAGGGAGAGGAGGGAGTAATTTITNTITTVIPGIGDTCTIDDHCPDDCTCFKHVCCPTELTCDAVRKYLADNGEDSNVCGKIQIPGCKAVYCGCAAGVEYCDEEEDGTGTCVACASAADVCAASKTNCGKQEVPEGCPEVFCNEGCPDLCGCDSCNPCGSRFCCNS